MYMSLFFLLLSLITYAFSHLWAKRTRPLSQNSYTKQWIYHGSVCDFKHLLVEWVQKQSHFHLIVSKENDFVISEQARWLSYGGFHHLRITQKPDALIVELSFQPKLISTGLDYKLIEDQFIEEKKLENVS